MFYYNSTAGHLKALYILLAAVNLKAFPLKEQPATGRGRGCRAERLTVLTKKLINDSITCYEKANGPNIQYHPVWFPDLDVHRNLSREERVQCGLDFITTALNQVLNDQKNYMNPEKTEIHENLAHSINMVQRLSVCLNITMGVGCTQKTSHPNMPPKDAPFRRKQWSTSLLNKSQRFLVWVIYKVLRPGEKDRVTE
ncbi:hypothetical protein DPEC_G00257220 [Dallia pectoralis]|uniref:Uncharacterized protein n=1 Tax=Dallia pectoralis TaxID=75939 RepID=A0ACC2FQG3_DALPE|nr:hypothetical protein DPEC_G00257220 [Dallia pectoralis]